MTGSHKYGWFKLVILMMAILPLCVQSAHAQVDLPDIPDLKRVTVDHHMGGMLIQWEASTDPEVEFYNIYREHDQAFIFVATVGATTLEFNHLSGGGQNLAYSVTAIDSLGNESLFEHNVHRAVSHTVEFDPCAPANLITWTGYQGWEGQVSGYRIYGGTAGGSLEEIGFVGPTKRTFIHEGIEVDQSYEYYIETINLNTLTSLTAIENVASIYPESPDYMSVDFVSVLDPTTVELQFSADVSGPVNNFRVVRRGNANSPFSEVTTFWNLTQSSQTVQDQVATGSSSFEYRVQSVYRPESCSSPIILSESNSGTSLLLDHQVVDQVVNLSWIPYSEYDNGLAGYVIQRRNGSGEFVDVQTVGPEINSWNETIQSVINGFQPGELQYKVVAMENPEGGSDPGISISNIVTVHVETHIQLPNAITPNSYDINSIFIPIIDFAPKEYLMVVVDRGGRKMFETTDPGEGWDGTFHQGDFVNEGVYVYYIQYTDFTGRSKSLTGNITVLYP
jgi:gliding motility-associated-like protein